MIQTIKEKIKQRRRQMLVHSYIYYELDDNIISDAQWAKWAKELEQLQKDYPKESAEVEEYEQFKDWDGSSGAFLNFSDAIKTVAKNLLKIKSPSETSIKSVDSLNISSKFAKNVQKSNLKSLNSKKSNTRKLF